MKHLILPEATTVSGFVVLGSLWEWLALWLVLINVAAFLVFGWDKFKAKYKETHPNARRVPEKTLFLLAGLGGSVGALLGMRVWHHKTRHRTFQLGIPGLLILHLLLLGLLVYVSQRG